MPSELLTWQRRRRRRELDTAAPTIDPNSPFWALFLEGTSLLATFDEPRALELLTRADSCCPQDPAIRAALDETLGEAEFLLNDYGLALEHLRRAQSTWAQLEEPLFEAEAHGWLGACLVQQGRYQDGFEALHAAQRSFETLDQKPRAARALNYLAVIHEELGDYHRAFEVYREALECAVADGDADMQGRVLANHGEALVNWGAPEQGLPVLGQAVDVLRGVGAHWHYGWCLLAIGRIHHSRDDDDKALQFHQAALEAVELGHSPRARVEVYAGLGELHSQRGQHVEGKRWLDKALTLATSLGIRREIFKTHKALSEAHKRAGEFELALRHHEQFHEVRSGVFDELARERVATLKAEFELERVMEAREREMNAKYEQLEQRAETLSHLSVRDGLTGLFNRRHFEEALGLELQRARSFGQTLCLALLDIDHFKRINDGYSHVVGDAVLRTVAQVLQKELRASDVAARYGGEEFGLILPHTGLDGARIAAEKVRVAIATSPWSHLTPGREVTASLGLAEWRAGESPTDFVRRADQALYAAKTSGRNRVRTSQ
ncbi:MAG: diguanylate cyclase [Archangium sp.]|nr:diguanylate cyclase [Archangium sp.]